MGTSHFRRLIWLKFSEIRMPVKAPRNGLAETMYLVLTAPPPQMAELRLGALRSFRT
jgi:hypothetical protein